MYVGIALYSDQLAVLSAVPDMDQGKRSQQVHITSKVHYLISRWTETLNCESLRSLWIVKFLRMRTHIHTHFGTVNLQ